LVDGERVRDAADRARVRLQALERDVAARGVRLAEIERGRRAVALASAERDRVADDRAEDERTDRHPPARAEQAPILAEIDLLLGFRIRRHCAATLAEAQAHIRARPSASATCGSQPSSPRMRATSAFVRRTSPRARSTCRTSSVRPETRSSRAIASTSEASSPPPTL